MSKLVIPKVPKYLEAPIKKAIPLAYGFMYARYGYRFGSVVVHLRANTVRGSYYRNDKQPHREYGNTPVAFIGCRRSKLGLYSRKTLGTYRSGVNVGPLPAIACGIIHELTHHVQHEEKRPRGEVETTRNELDFLKEVFPEWYAMIMLPPPKVHTR